MGAGVKNQAPGGKGQAPGGKGQAPGGKGQQYTPGTFGPQSPQGAMALQNAYQNFARQQQMGGGMQPVGNLQGAPLGGGMAPPPTQSGMQQQLQQQGLPQYPQPVFNPSTQQAAAQNAYQDFARQQQMMQAQPQTQQAMQQQAMQQQAMQQQAMQAQAQAMRPAGSMIPQPANPLAQPQQVGTEDPRLQAMRAMQQLANYRRG